MIKINLMVVCALILATLYSIGVNGQTKLWGVGALVGQADAEFQNPFVQTGTIGSYSPTAWTALSINQSGGAVSPGNAYWTRSLTGYSIGAYAAPPGATPPPLGSPSQANGVAIFDSDYLDNNGTGVLGSGSSPSSHRGELISPRIDLSGYTDTALVVQFYSDYRDYDIAELSISMSVDDGQNWSAPYDYRILQASSSEGWVRVLMNTITQGVSSLSQCRLKFIFDKDYYYAMVDDITIEVAPDYDIAIGNPNPNGNFLVDGGDFVKMGGSANQAIMNIDPTNLKEWFWGAKVVNFGGKTLYPQDGANIQVAIDFYDGLSAPIYNVYKDTMMIDTLLAGDAEGVVMIDYVRDLNFILYNGVGQYTVKYWVEHNNALDGSTENDTVFHTFNITDLPGYISKSRRSLTDGRAFSSRSIFPNGGGISALEYGSVYYFPKGMTSDLNIDSVEFRYRIPNAYAGPTTQHVFVNINKLVDGSGSSSSNGILDSDELLTVGIGLVTINGVGTTKAPGSYNVGVVSVFVTPNGDTLEGLDDHGIYYISLLQNPSAVNGAATFDATTGLWFGVDDYNYYLNTVMTVPDTIINPSPLRISDAGGNATWYWTGFGADIVPSIGVYVAPLYSGTQILEEKASTIGLNLYPNPVSSTLEVEVSLEDTEDVQYIITDLAGRVLLIRSSENVVHEKQRFDTRSLATGVYFMSIRTSKESISQKFIKK